MDTQKLARISIALAVAVGSSPALAENWVISRGDHPWFQVDTDSIRRGSDNLVYYRSRGSTFEYDKAVDCQKRIVFFLKRLTLEFFKKHMPEDKIYSNWRSEGRAVVERTVSGAELQYVCANV